MCVCVCVSVCVCLCVCVCVCVCLCQSICLHLHANLYVCVHYLLEEVEVDEEQRSHGEERAGHKDRPPPNPVAQLAKQQTS